MKCSYFQIPFSLLFIFFTFIPCIMAGDGRWVSMGGPHYLPKVEAITAGISNSDYIIYACDSTGSGTILKSSDYGLTWEYSLTSGEFHTDVCAHPQNAAVAYALNPYTSGSNDQYDGVWATLDGGYSWRWRNAHNGLDNLWLESIYILKNDLTGSTAYVGCSSTLNDPDAVYYTDDYGENWSAMSRTGLPENIVVDDLVVDEADNEHIYLVNSILGSPDGLVYRSTDGGNSWEIIATREDFPGLSYYSIGSIAMDPTNENVLFVLVRNNFADSYLFYTLNAREINPANVIWNLVPYNSHLDGIPGNGTDLICDSRGIVYATTFFGFLVSWDQRGGQQYLRQLPYQISEPIGDPYAYSVMVNPTNDNEIYVGTQSSFYLSNNGGDSFEERVGELFTYDCKAIVASLPYVFSGNTTNDLSSFGSITRSSNSGQTWANRFLMTGPGFAFSYCTDLDWDFESNTILSAQTFSPPGLSGFAGMLKSVDMGSNWTSPEPPDTPNNGSDYVSCIAFDNYSTTQQELLFAGFATKFNNPSNRVKRVALSIDNGETWSSYFSVNPGDVSIKDIAFGYEPYWADYLIVADSFNLAYVSSNFGSNWSNIGDALLPHLGYSVAVSNIAQSSAECPVYIGTDEGLWRNSYAFSGSDSWENKSYGIDPQFLEITKVLLNPAGNEILYCSARNINDEYKVYISPDSARSWVDFSSGLPYGVTVNDFSIDPSHSDTIYAGTSDGVYKLKNVIRSGTITSRETWGPGKVIVNGDIIVDQGAELEIAQPCTVLITYAFDLTASGNEPGLCELVVAGQLNAVGDASNPIIFSSSNPSEPLAGDWSGILVKDEGELNLNYCTVEHALNAIEAHKYSTIRLDHCDIENNKISGVTCIQPASISISNSEFTDNGLYAASIIGPIFEASFDSVDIGGNHEYGIRFFNGSGIEQAPLIVYNSTITTTNLNAKAGIEIDRNLPSDLPLARIANTGISYFGAGIASSFGSEGSLIGPGVDSEFNYNYGIVLELGCADIIGEYGAPNSFSFNGEGIVGTANSGEVRRSYIENNWGGVEVIESFLDFGNINNGGENSFEGNSEFFIWADTGPIMNAQYNWWGTTDLNIIYDNVSSNVIVEPILLERLNLGKTAAGIPDIPDNFDLKSAYPNPFNATANIEFAVPAQSTIEIVVYNILGQEIRTLYTGEATPGIHTVVWDGKNGSGEEVASGLYLYTLRTEERMVTQKMVLLK